MNNIVTARFLNSRVATAPSQWQYDYGQILDVKGIDELPSVFEAHFCNTGAAKTVTQIGTDGQVAIPDECFLTGKRIDVYIYLHTGEDDGETEYHIIIPVNARPRPSDTPPTPVQQDAITQAIAALNDALAGIEVGADKTPDLSGYATKTELNGKVDKVSGKGLSTNDYTTNEKNKLAGIEAGADKTPDLSHYVTDSNYNPDSKTSAQTQPVGVDSNGKLWAAPGGSTITVDDALSSTSTNPAQNKVIKSALDSKGTYSKPSGGIPKSDLAAAVKTSLGKADTALQSVPSTYRTAAAQDTIDAGKIDKPTNPSSGAFLVWNGTAWVAQTLATWQGGSY